jgi:hypothetical protein
MSLLNAHFLLAATGQPAAKQPAGHRKMLSSSMLRSAARFQFRGKRTNFLQQLMFEVQD